MKKHCFIENSYLTYLEPLPSSSLFIKFIVISEFTQMWDYWLLRLRNGERGWQVALRGFFGTLLFCLGSLEWMLVLRSWCYIVSVGLNEQPFVGNGARAAMCLMVRRRIIIKAASDIPPKQGREVRVLISRLLHLEGAIPLLLLMIITMVGVRPFSNSFFVLSELRKSMFWLGFCSILLIQDHFELRPSSFVQNRLRLNFTEKI